RVVAFRGAGRLRPDRDRLGSDSRSPGAPMRLTLVLFAFLLAACAEKPAALGGDPEQGKLLLRQYGCGTCHEIPKVATADGKVGPPLTRLGKRVYLAGSIPNTPENLSRWIQAPQEF